MISWFRPRWRWWHLALLMTAMVLELFARPELAMTSQPSVDPLAEVVLDTGLGWRIILFVALPLYLFNVAREAGGQVEDQVLLRLGGYPQLALHGFATSVAGAVPIITCLVTPSVAIGLGAASLARPSWTLGTSGQLAVAALAVLTVTINFALFGLAVLLGTQVMGRMGGVVMAAILFVVSALGSADNSSMGPFNVGFGVQPGPSMEYFDSWFLGLLIPTCLTAAFLIIWIALLESRTRELRVGTWLTPSVVLVVVVLRFGVGAWQTANEALIAGFYGTGGSMVDYLFIVIVAGAPTWYAMADAEAKYQSIQFGLVRSGSLLKWAWWAHRRYLMLIPLYFCLVGTVAVLVLWLRLGFGSFDAEGSPLSVRTIGYQFLINGTLQGWAFLCLAVVGRIVAGAPWGGLTVLAGLLGFGATGPGALYSSLTNLGVGQIFGGVSVRAVSIVLVSWLLAIGLVGGFFLHRHGPRSVERLIEK